MIQENLPLRLSVKVILKALGILGKCIAVTLEGKALKSHRSICLGSSASVGARQCDFEW